MKGKTTLLGVKRKITLWNASSVEVWYRELSLSTSLRTLLLVSIFSTLQRALEPRDMKHEVNKNSKLMLSQNIEYNRQLHTWLKPLLTISALADWMLALWEERVVVDMYVLHVVHHGCPFGDFLWPWGWGCCTPIHMVADSTLPLLDHLAVLLFSHFSQFLRKTWWSQKGLIDCDEKHVMYVHLNIQS